MQREIYIDTTTKLNKWSSANSFVVANTQGQRFNTPHGPFVAAEEESSKSSAVQLVGKEAAADSQ